MHISRCSPLMVALVCALAFVATSAQASPLPSTPPGFVSPVPDEMVTLNIADRIATNSQAFTGTGFSGVLVSEVYRRPSDSNQLTFTYQLSNNASSANVLHRVTVSSFDGFTTDVSRQGPAAQIIPTLADRSTPDVVGFSFLDGFGQGPIRPGQQSALLIVETNAITHVASTAAIIDGTTAMVGTFAPLMAIPEPSTWALGILGVLGLLGMVRKARR
jgi:hypothetical protein